MVTATFSMQIERLLFFNNPHIPYSFQLLNGDLVGYSCLFTEEILK